MAKGKLHTYLSVIILLCLCSISFAGLDPSLVFKMTADKTDLLPGEQTTVHVWAWIYDTAGVQLLDNGLEAWQTDLSVDNTGVIQIVGGINFLAPDPAPGWSQWDAGSVNSPITGEIRQVQTIQQVWGAPSYTGVGVDNDIDNPLNYSEIFNFTIEAISSIADSKATYTLMDDGGGLFYGYLTDGTSFDNDDLSAYGGVYFYDTGSANVFTIVPEPASMVLFVTAAAFAMRRRKR
ncbi:MAG: PEP-CTERM sorting domain-containing protein [Planctomycetota bacterium]